MDRFWSDMTDVEQAEVFAHFTPEQFLAAQKERERIYGVPADHKCTDPITLAKVAKLMVSVDRVRAAA